MKINYILLGFLCYQASVFPMEEESIPEVPETRPAHDALARMRSFIRVFMNLKFKENVKKYQERPSEKLRRFLLDAYDKADAGEKGEYEAVVVTKLNGSVDETLRAAVSDSLEDEYDYSEAIDLMIEKLRMDAFKELIDTFTIDKKALVKELFDSFKTSRFGSARRKEAEAKLEEFHSKNKALIPLLEALKTNQMPRVARLIDDINEANDPLDGASLLLLLYCGVTKNELKSSAPLGQSPLRGLSGGSRQTVVPAPTKERVYVKLKSDRRGIGILTLEQLPYFGTIKEAYDRLEGRTSKTPIAIPLTKEEFDILCEYVDSYIDGGVDALDYEVLFGLSLENVATLIKQAQLLRMDILRERFLLKLVELARTRDKQHFADTSTILESFAFDKTIQEMLSPLFFPHEQQELLRSLLHSRLESSGVSECHAGCLSSFYSIASSANLCRVQWWDTQELAERVQLLFKTQVRSVSYCQSPYAVVCTEDEAHLFDLTTGRSCKSIKKEAISDFPGCFWGSAVNSEGTVVALGCGGKIVLWNVSTGAHTVLTPEVDLALSKGIQLKFTRDGAFLFEVRELGVKVWDLKKRSVTLSSAERTAPIAWVGDVGSDELVSADLSMLSFLNVVQAKERTVEINGTILCCDSAGSKFIVNKQEKCFCYDSVASTYNEIVTGLRVRYARFSPEDTVVAFILEDGSIEIRDCVNWAIKVSLQSGANGVCFSRDGQSLIAFDNQALVLWHYFDEHVEYLKKPLSMSQAFLFSHCTDLLKADESLQRKVTPRLLKGLECAARALFNVACDEDMDGGISAAKSPSKENIQNDNNASAESVDAKAVKQKEVQQLFEQAEELRKAKRFSEAAPVFLQLDALSKQGTEVPIQVIYRLGRWYTKGKGGLQKDAARGYEYLMQTVKKNSLGAL